MTHTPLPWKAVSTPHFDSGLVYTSIQPVNVDEEAMKPLAMMNGEYHVCRMSHTAAEWRFNYHRANAAFIVKAVNAYDTMINALRRIADPANIHFAGDAQALAKMTLEKIGEAS